MAYYIHTHTVLHIYTRVIYICVSSSHISGLYSYRSGARRQLIGIFLCIRAAKVRIQMIIYYWKLEHDLLFFDAELSLSSLLLEFPWMKNSRFDLQRLSHHITPSSIVACFGPISLFLLLFPRRSLTRRLQEGIIIFLEFSDFWISSDCLHLYVCCRTSDVAPAIALRCCFDGGQDHCCTCLSICMNRSLRYA